MQIITYVILKSSTTAFTFLYLAIYYVTGYLFIKMAHKFEARDVKNVEVGDSDVWSVFKQPNCQN
jgi:hypothetical protein